MPFARRKENRRGEGRRSTVKGKEGIGRGQVGGSKEEARLLEDTPERLTGYNRST